jgi:hypothetical protein
MAEGRPLGAEEVDADDGAVWVRTGAVTIVLGRIREVAESVPVGRIETGGREVCEVTSAPESVEVVGTSAVVDGAVVTTSVGPDGVAVSVDGRLVSDVMTGTTGSVVVAEVLFGTEVLIGMMVVSDGTVSDGTAGVVMFTDGMSVIIEDDGPVGVGGWLVVSVTFVPGAGSDEGSGRMVGCSVVGVVVSLEPVGRGSGRMPLVDGSVVFTGAVLPESVGKGRGSMPPFSLVDGSVVFAGAVGTGDAVTLPVGPGRMSLSMG